MKHLYIKRSGRRPFAKVFLAALIGAPCALFADLHISYEYDLADRLTNVVYSTGPMVRYTLDSRDNRIDYYSTGTNADLSLVMAGGPNPVALDASMLLWMVVSNAGPANAAETTLIGVWGRQARAATASVSQGTCEMSATAAVCRLETLSPGAGASVWLSLVATNVGMITNAARVYGFGGEPTPENNERQVVLRSDQDTNHDGIPDAWVLLYFTNLAQGVAGADPDKDGFPNEQEYAAGTNPTDATSRVELDGFSMGSDGARKLTFWVPASRWYFLDGTTNLVDGASWTSQVQIILNTNALVEVGDTNNPLQFYLYRARAVLP